MTTERVDIVVEEKGKGAEAIARGFDKVAASSGKAVSPVKALTGAVVAATAAFGARALIGTLRDYSQEMSTVKALTKATESEFRALNETAQRLGSTTRFSGSEAAQGMAFLARAGFETDEVLSSIEGTLRLAQAGALDLGSAADIASNILTGFRLEASETGKVVDILALAANSTNTSVSQLGEGMKFVAPIAAALELSIQDTTAAIGALSDAGLQGGLAGRGLRSVLANLEAPSEKARDVLEDLGLSADDVRVSSVGLTSAIEALDEKNISVAQSLEFFGREAGAAFAILQNSVGDVKAFSAELDNADGTAKRIADTMDDNLNGAALGLQSAVEGLILTLGDLGATSALTIFVKSLTAGVRGFTTVMEKAEPAINAVVVGLLALGAQAIIATIAGATFSVTGLTGAVVRLNAALFANPFVVLAAATAAAATIVNNMADVTRQVEDAQVAYNGALSVAKTALNEYQTATEGAVGAVEDLNKAQLILAREQVVASIETTEKALEKQRKELGRAADEWRGFTDFFTTNATVYGPMSDGLKELTDNFKTGAITADDYVVSLNDMLDVARNAGGTGDPQVIAILEKIGRLGSSSTTEQGLAQLRQRLEDLNIALDGGKIPAREVAEGIGEVAAMTAEAKAALASLGEFESAAADSGLSNLQREIAEIEGLRDEVVAQLQKTGRSTEDIQRATDAAERMIANLRAKSAGPEDTSATDRIIATTQALRDNVTVLSQTAGVEREIARNLISAGIDSADRTSAQATAIVELTQTLYGLQEAETKVKKEKDKQVKTYADYSREISQQIGLLSVEAESRDEIARVLAIENELKRSNITLTAAQRVALADKLAVLSRSQEIDAAEIELKEQLSGTSRDLATEVEALNNLYADGAITVEEYGYKVQELGLRQLELQNASGQGGFGDGFIAELGRMSQSAENFKVRTGKVFGQFFSDFSKGAGDAFGQAIVFGDDLGKALLNVAQNALAQLISSLVQMGLQFVINAAIGGALATAATAASATQAAALASAWAPAAAFASLATLGSNAAPASAALVGTVALSEGIGAAASAFADGGQVSGPGGPRDDKVPAWLSDGEFVINAASTAKYLPLLTQINNDTAGDSLGRLAAASGGSGSAPIATSSGGSTFVISAPMTLTYAPGSGNKGEQDEDFMQQFRDYAELAIGDAVRKVVAEEKEEGGMLS